MAKRDTGKPTKGVAEATKDADDEDEPIPTVPESRLTFLRDSAFALGAATALLYFTSAAYGETYLSVFEVSNGFHSFGLGNLAMLSVWELMGLIVFTFLLHAGCSSTKRRPVALAIVMVCVVGAYTPLSVVRYSHDVRGVDIAVLTATAVVGYGIVSRFYNDYAPNITKLERVLDKYRRLGLTDAQAETLPLRNGIKATDAVRYLTWRVWELRARTWLFCAYATMFVAVPALATWKAIEAAKQGHYVAPDAQSPVRVPVYWVGDRVVYITQDGSCNVNIEIAGALKARHECGTLLTAVTKK